MATFTLPRRPKKAYGTSRIRAVSGIRTPGGVGIQDRSIIAPKNTNLDNLELSSRMAKFRPIVYNLNLSPGKRRFISCLSS